MSVEGSSADLEAARKRSKAVWDDMAAGWHDVSRDELWECSRPISEWMVRKLDPKPGETVLELAAGSGETGFLAAKLVGETGRLISTDFAAGMVAAARERAAEMTITNAEFRVLDAERMDLETNRVDGILCRWGYMLMVDPSAAFAETRRVLRPGGRLVFSSFAAADRNPWVSLLIRILVSQGHLPPPDPEAPGIFALADPNRVHKLVTAAGFAELEIEEVAWRWRYGSRDAYWRFMTEAAGAISPILRALPADAQTAVRNQLHEAVQPFHAGDGYDFPALCLNVVAQ